MSDLSPALSPSLPNLPAAPANGKSNEQANPYVGPRSFRPGEKLYGREHETSELIDLLIAERIVLLYSPSGAGKSSLINASLFPCLKEQDFFPLPSVRVNLELPAEAVNLPAVNRYVFSVMLSLEENLPPEKRRTLQELAGLTLAQYLECYTEEAGIADSEILFFDQFEEVITIDPTDRDAKVDFFKQLGDALRDRSRWALFALREDFLAGLDPYLRFIPTRFASRFRLNFLESAGAMEAIQQPARACGVDFRQEAAQKLVDDLRQVKVQQADGTMAEVLGPYVEPVQLQVVCYRVWSLLETGNQVIGLEHLEKVGDTNRALSDYYAQCVQDAAVQTGISERLVRKWFDSRLITVQGIRSQVLLGTGQSEGLDNRTIRKLEKSYLVRAEKRGGATWFELSHDRLIRPVRENNAEWFAHHLVTLQRQAEIWQEQGRPEGQLLIGKSLNDAIAWAERHRPEMTWVETDFLEVCKKARSIRQRDRTLNRVIQGLFGISIVIGAIAVYLYFQSLQLNRRAVSLLLASAGIANMDSDPERSILLSMEAFKQSLQYHLDANQAVEALHKSLQLFRLEKNLTGHTDRVYSSAFSPDGTQVASASLDGTLRIWDANSGQEWMVIQGPQEGLSDVEYSPDGKLLAAGGLDGTVLVFDGTTGQEKAVLAGHTGEVWNVAFQPDGMRLASASLDGTVRVWDMATFEPVFVLRHSAGVDAIAYSPDSKRLASGDEDGYLWLWDAVTGLKSVSIQAHSDIVNGIEFSSDGLYVATASADRSARIWSLLGGNLKLEINGHTDWVYRAVFTPDGDRLITSSSDRTVRVWELSSGRELFRIAGHSSQVFDVDIDPTGKHLVTASQDQTVRIWNISSSGSRELFTQDTGNRAYSVSASPDGSQLAVGGRKAGIQILDAGSGELLMSLPAHDNKEVEDLQYYDQGSRLASVGRDGYLYLWDAAAGTVQKRIETGLGMLWAMDIRPDGKLLATAGDAGLKVWDTGSGEEVMALPAGGVGYGMAVSTDFHPNLEHILAAGYQDGTVILWNVSSGQSLLELTISTESVEGLQFNPVGSRMATISEDGIVSLWEFQEETSSLILLKKMEQHTSALYGVAFSKDGELLATAGADLNIWLWNAKDGSPMYLLKGHSDRIYDLTFAQHGDHEHLISVGRDQTVRGYTLDASELIELAQSRVTRGLTDQECIMYLFQDNCQEK